MSGVRLLADDLTGALDTAARLAARAGPLPVLRSIAAARKAAGNLALDAACREVQEPIAAERFASGAGVLAGAGLAFLKLDSLLRGHAATAIATCLAAGGFDHAIVAPAFPAQGRTMRDGRLMLPHGIAGPDLRLEFAARGVALALCRPGEAAAPGASLWDAASDADLLLAVAAGRALAGRVLWCGSAGLAGALAGTPPAAPLGPRPLLALIGSDHPVSARQVAAAAPFHVRLDEADAGEVAIGGLLTTGAAVATVALPPGLGREDAARRIAARFARLMVSVGPPGTLLVAGGETLAAACDSLGATQLEVRGEWEPGLAVSRLVDGAWAGITVLSKSGAFGDDDVLSRLTQAARG